MGEKISVSLNKSPRKCGRMLRMGSSARGMQPAIVRELAQVLEDCRRAHAATDAHGT